MHSDTQTTKYLSWNLTAFIGNDTPFSGSRYSLQRCHLWGAISLLIYVCFFGNAHSNGRWLMKFTDFEVVKVLLVIPIKLCLIFSNAFLNGKWYIYWVEYFWWFLLNFVWFFRSMLIQMGDDWWIYRFWSGESLNSKLFVKLTVNFLSNGVNFCIFASNVLFGCET